ncbi:MAG: rRNA maturation RNase YbeY [Actinomycetota bacterium]|nr:rRNA maturation RNase YbeY [Actinomycetota bacterium]
MTQADPADVHRSRGDLTVGCTDGRTSLDVPPHDLDPGGICALALAVLEGEGCGSGRLDVHLVDVDAMAELNQEHMDAVGPTDVLSFPLDCDDDVLFDEADERLLGDLVLCPVVAAEQAAGHVGSFDGEMALLVIHGVLHILGFDHADAQELTHMQARERIYLEPLGHAHPGPVT